MRLKWILFAMLVRPGVASSLALTGYHSLAEIRDYMLGLEREAPELFSVRHLGTSDEGRLVSAVIIGSSPHAGKTRLFLNGAHHGDELITPEVVLAFMEGVRRNRFNPRMQRLLANTVIVCLPVVNPDGLARSSRYGSGGIDPNRDYPANQGRSKLAITRLVRELLEEFKFQGAIAFHSGIKGVFFPRGYSAETTADHVVFRSLAGAFAREIDTGNVKRSFLDYPTRGEFIDYAYDEHGTLAITAEVALFKSPPPELLGSVLARSVRGVLAFLSSLKTQVKTPGPSLASPMPWTLVDEMGPNAR